MWVLVVLQIVAGSATVKSSLPITYTGVVMQEFSTKESCLNAKLVIDRLNQSASGATRNGILAHECIEK